MRAIQEDVKRAKGYCKENAPDAPQVELPPGMVLGSYHPHLVCLCFTDFNAL